MPEPIFPVPGNVVLRTEVTQSGARNVPAERRHRCCSQGGILPRRRHRIDLSPYRLARPRPIPPHQPEWRRKSKEKEEKKAGKTSEEKEKKILRIFFPRGVCAATARKSFF